MCVWSIIKTLHSKLWHYTVQATLKHNQQPSPLVMVRFEDLYVEWEMICSMWNYCALTDLLSSRWSQNWISWKNWTLFSKTLSLHSSLTTSDQVSHPYKTTGKNIVLYILIFTVLDSKLEDKRFCTEWQQAFPDFNLLLISSWIVFWFFRIVLKYLNCFTVSSGLLPL